MDAPGRQRARELRQRRCPEPGRVPPACTAWCSACLLCPFPSSGEWGRAGREECGVWARWREGGRIFQLLAQSLCTQGDQHLLCPCKPAALCRRKTSAALQSKKNPTCLTSTAELGGNRNEYWWGKRLGRHPSAYSWEYIAPFWVDSWQCKAGLPQPALLWACSVVPSRVDTAA